MLCYGKDHHVRIVPTIDLQWFYSYIEWKLRGEIRPDESCIDITLKFDFHLF